MSASFPCKLFASMAILLLAACATRPASTPTRQWQPPCGECVRGVVNFTKVSDKVWRGAQPVDAEAFRRLEQAGVKTVINLRHDHDDYPLLRDTGMRYFWLPMRAWHPESEDIVILLSALRRLSADPSRWPVFVHCAAGKDRTGYAIASYRIIEENWQADDAIHEMFDFHYNEIWFRNPGFLRRLEQSRADIQARIGRAP